MLCHTTADRADKNLRAADHPAACADRTGSPLRRSEPSDFDLPPRDANATRPKSRYAGLSRSATPPTPALKYHWKSYDDQSIPMVDTNALDPSGKSVVKLSTKGKQTVLDVTKEMKWGRWAPSPRFAMRRQIKQGDYAEVVSPMNPGRVFPVKCHRLVPRSLPHRIRPALSGRDTGSSRYH